MAFAGDMDPIDNGVVMEKHPPGLKVLFLTEMWERFSFYSMANYESDHVHGSATNVRRGDPFR